MLIGSRPETAQVVRLENIGLRYGYGPEVLKDVSFHLDEGEFRFLTERFKLQLRGAAFNLTNTPQFQPPGTTVGSSTFGVVATTAPSATTELSDTW